MKIIIKKCSVLFIACVFLTLVTLPTTDGNVIFRKKPESSVVNIHASSSYEYGFNAGKLFKKQYRLFNFLARFMGESTTVEENIQNRINHLEQYCPYILEELRGLSDSLNIELERLIYLKDYFRYCMGGSCTNTLSTGSATKGDMTYLTDSFDMRITPWSIILISAYRSFLSKNLFVKNCEPYPYRYICFGLPVLLEWPIMNEKGLGLGYAAIAGDGNRIDTGPGLSPEEIWSLAMMSCKNVTEVAELYESVERECKDYGRGIMGDTPAWCDREGGILAIEYSHNHILNVFGDSTEITGTYEDILWHTNFHQWLDPDLTGSIYPEDYPSTKKRAERSKELLEENFGDITLDTCKQILRDHDGGFNPNRGDSGDICRHPDFRGLAITTISWILNPQEMKIYITHGSPCNSEFECYNALEIFV